MYNSNKIKNLNKGQVLAIHKASRKVEFCHWSNPVTTTVGKMKVVFGINPLRNKYFCVVN